MINLFGVFLLYFLCAAKTRMTVAFDTIPTAPRMFWILSTMVVVESTPSALSPFPRVEGPPVTSVMASTAMGTRCNVHCEVGVKRERGVLEQRFYWTGRS